MTETHQDIKDDGAFFVGKEEIELQVKPVNYDDEDFDKFSYFKTIGSWEMAEQLFRKTEIVRNKLEEQLLTANSQIEDLLQRNKELKEALNNGYKLIETAQRDSDYDDILNNLSLSYDELLEGLE